MEKKGQTTIFIVIGVILILTMSILVYLQNREQNEIENAYVNERETIQNFVQLCVDKTSQDALFFFGLTGGEYTNKVFNNYLVYDKYYKIPYYFYYKSEMPSIYSIENNILATYVNNNLKRCLKEFSIFKGFTFESKNDVDTIVTINKNDVVFKVQYPVTAVKERSVTTFNQYFVKINSNLSEILNITENIVNMASLNDKIIHWEYLTDVTKKGFNITAHAEKDDTIIYRIVDPYSLIHNEQYYFQFAVKVTQE